jgi:hypothetical protein
VISSSWSRNKEKNQIYKLELSLSHKSSDNGNSLLHICLLSILDKIDVMLTVMSHLKLSCGCQVDVHPPLNVLLQFGQTSAAMHLQGKPFREWCPTTQDFVGYIFQDRWCQHFFMWFWCQELAHGRASHEIES